MRPSWARRAKPVPKKLPDTSKAKKPRLVQVIGEHSVYGLIPGEVGEIHVTGGELRHLVKAGHVKEVDRTEPPGPPRPPGPPADRPKDQAGLPVPAEGNGHSAENN